MSIYLMILPEVKHEIWKITTLHVFSYSFSCIWSGIWNFCHFYIYIYLEKGGGEWGDNNDDTWFYSGISVPSNGSPSGTYIPKSPCILLCTCPTPRTNVHDAFFFPLYFIFSVCPKCSHFYHYVFHITLWTLSVFSTAEISIWYMRELYLFPESVPVWVLLWRVNSSDLANLLSHPFQLHSKGRSPTERNKKHNRGY